jgi:hypothetical protein
MADWLERYRGYILIVLLNLIVLGGIFFFLRRPEPEPISILPPEPTATPLPTPPPRPLCVYVSGAVAHPDVYELPYDSIVKDAIEAAGGPTGEADLNRINLARRVPCQSSLRPLVTFSIESGGRQGEHQHCHCRGVEHSAGYRSNQSPVHH